MPAIATQRIALSAAQFQAVTPPIEAHRVSIGNATADDLKISGEQDLSNYVVVAAGFERLLETKENRVRFTRFSVAFYLYSAVGGTVVLEWL